MKKYEQVLCDLRTDNDLMQRDIAALLQVTQQAYSRYETGGVELPLHHLKTLCEYYQVSADYILGLSKEMEIRR